MWRLVCLIVVAGAYAQINLEVVKPCGKSQCTIEQYCSQDTNQCAQCSTICNKTHHNFDSGVCTEFCKEYLMDLRYMRISDFNSIQHQAQAALIMSGVALALLLIVLILVCRGSFSWRYLKQKLQSSKNQVKQNPGGLTHHNPHAEMPKPKHELKLEIRNPAPPKRTNQPLNVNDLQTRTSQTEKSQGATTPKTVSTAISNRHPAEDTTLDFSYDNMGMNITPPEQPAPSHKF